MFANYCATQDVKMFCYQHNFTNEYLFIIYKQHANVEFPKSIFSYESSDRECPMCLQRHIATWELFCSISIEHNFVEIDFETSMVLNLYW